MREYGDHFEIKDGYRYDKMVHTYNSANTAGTGMRLEEDKFNEMMQQEV